MSGGNNGVYRRESGTPIHLGRFFRDVSADYDPPIIGSDMRPLLNRIRPLIPSGVFEEGFEVRLDEFVVPERAYTAVHRSPAIRKFPEPENAALSKILGNSHAVQRLENFLRLYMPRSSVREAIENGVVAVYRRVLAGKDGRIGVTIGRRDVPRLDDYLLLVDRDFTWRMVDDSSAHIHFGVCVYVWMNGQSRRKKRQREKPVLVKCYSLQFQSKNSTSLL